MAGAGTMGAGIAHVAAMHGCTVHPIEMKGALEDRSLFAQRTAG